MMYATVEELAEALRVRPTPENTPLLETCLAAAAEEIDGFLDKSVGVWPEPVPASLNRVNVARAVEWFKAADAAFGTLGSEAVGTLPAPSSSFRRYAVTILSFKDQFGVA